MNAVCELHMSDPPVVHGHLTPFNIFIEGDKVYLTDLGFDSLRKYASLFHNYSNKTAYTAPELLKESGAIASPKTAKADIYSIGVILW